MNLKIGILTGEFNDLSNWQLRIIESILNDPTLELNLVIQKYGNRRFSKVSRSDGFLSKLSPRRVLLALQLYIERKVFKEVYSVDSEGLKRVFDKLPKIEIGQDYKIGSDVPETEIIKQIQRSNLDVIINLGIYDLPIEVLKIPKYGIWDCLHTDFRLMPIGPSGFLEVLQKEPAIGFTLLKRTSGTQVEILDHAFFNREWSMVETAKIAQEGGVSVLMKNLRKLQNGHRFDSNPLDMPAYKFPGLYDVSKYILQFHGHLFAKIVQKIAYKFWGKRHECWSIFMGKGSFLKSELSSLKPLEMPKDEFWADPFLFEKEGTDYVFFENYSYKTNRGKISCGVIDGEELIDIVDVLDVDYHLSFPFIFEENGAIFLMPETSENKRLEIYKAVEFPTKWELFTTAFEGEMVADAFFYDDAENQKWLFVNKQAAETSPMNSELFIYKTDSIKLDNLQPHAQNPVLIDARVARNGGSIFVQEDKLYRPSQRNTDGIYGRSLNINRIKKLTIDEYEEENVRIFEPNFDKNLMATHHLHQTEERFVIDAAYKSK